MEEQMQDVCHHHWVVKEWFQVKIKNGDRETERRNVTKLFCVKCLRIKKLIDREMV